MILYFFISLLFANSSADHEFKMSVCEIVYEENAQHFQVHFYLFQDDLKEAVYGDPESPLLEKEKIASYILAKTKIELKDKNVELMQREMKEKDDQVMMTFFSEKINIEHYSTLSISNQIMIEKFRTQTNMVYVSLPNRSKWTQILNAQKTEAVYEL
ncbi:MAG: DUF6702 family protein [Bacteroidota bacterium]